jgi:hypothetical protein
MKITTRIYAGLAAFRDPDLVGEAVALRETLLELHLDDEAAILCCGIFGARMVPHIFRTHPGKQREVMKCVQG